MDLDQDGLSDVLSGSWPGELYFFRRSAEGSFAEGTPLLNQEDEPINLGAASTVFAVDWDQDDDMDLLVGSISGKVGLVLNKSGGAKLAFGKDLTLVSLAEQQRGDSHPVAADWDGDGDLDLLVGHSEGGVVWYRNVGTRKQPQLAEPEELIPDSPSPWTTDAHRNPSDWGVRAKICVVDWNRDGRLDIVLGDRCGSFSDAPDRTPEELARERSALAQLPRMRKAWGEAFRQYRERLNEGKAPEDDQQLTALLDRMRRLKQEIARCQEVQAKFEPQTQAHGYVWLFQRKPATVPTYVCLRRTRRPAPN